MNAASFMDDLVRRNPGETEFHQAVREVVESVLPVVEARPVFRRKRILERMTEPDRAVSFRVAWEDDKGEVRVNRGYRVQFNNAIGPYKGGLRFDPSVDLGVLKFLGFEQTLKNALTGLPMGGAKGGSDFDPKGRSDSEVMRFCQSFMTELQRHVGPDRDVPAGDIGVGAREIGYLFGQWRRITGEWAGTLTGKGLAYGGSPVRAEATGWGCVYFAREMLRDRGETLMGRTCAISGSGNVAQFAALKLMELGARVVTLSDRGGTIHAPEGLTRDDLAAVAEAKSNGGGRLSDAAAERGWEDLPGVRPWEVPCDLAFPCATQNEIGPADAEALIGNGCRGVVEGANMPATYEATKIFDDAGVVLAPGKAANAGGVAISGLEMTQNAMRLRWAPEEVDERLQQIMRGIHVACVAHGRRPDGTIDYVRGANVAGFLRVGEAMLAQGLL